MRARSRRVRVEVPPVAGFVVPDRDLAPFKAVRVDDRRHKERVRVRGIEPRADAFRRVAQVARRPVHRYCRRVRAERVESARRVRLARNVQRAILRIDRKRVDRVRAPVTDERFRRVRHGRARIPDHVALLARRVVLRGVEVVVLENDFLHVPLQLHLPDEFGRATVELVAPHPNLLDIAARAYRREDLPIGLRHSQRANLVERIRHRKLKRCDLISRRVVLDNSRLAIECVLVPLAIRLDVLAVRNLRRRKRAVRRHRVTKRRVVEPRVVRDNRLNVSDLVRARARRAVFRVPVTLRDAVDPRHRVNRRDVEQPARCPLRLVRERTAVMHAANRHREPHGPLTLRASGAPQPPHHVRLRAIAIAPPVIVP